MYIIRAYNAQGAYVEIRTANWPSDLLVQALREEGAVRIDIALPVV